MKLRIPIQLLTDSATIPQYQSEGAAGMDLHADEECTVPSQGVRIVSTGLAVAIPFGYEAQIRPRSGLAAKHHITVLNSPATIDSDYRGEIKVILVNHGTKAFRVEYKDRIAQLVVAPVCVVSFGVVQQLPHTYRGDGGFGSTGTR